MKPLERLRQLVATGDPNGTVTLRWLDEVLRGELEAEPGGAPDRDLTIAEVAEEVGRAPSTVRGWLSDGELRGYKLNGRDWRVPRSALEEWRRAQMNGTPAGQGEDIDLGAWRRTG